MPKSQYLLNASTSSILGCFWDFLQENINLEKKSMASSNWCLEAVCRQVKQLFVHLLQPLYPLA